MLMSGQLLQPRTEAKGEMTEMTADPHVTEVRWYSSVPRTPPGICRGDGVTRW